MFKGLNLSKIVQIPLPKTRSEEKSPASSKGLFHTLGIQKKIFPPKTMSSEGTLSQFFFDADSKESSSLSSRISLLKGDDSMPQSQPLKVELGSEEKIKNWILSVEGSSSPKKEALQNLNKPEEDPTLQAAPRDLEPSVIDQNGNGPLHRMFLSKKRNESFNDIKQEITTLLQSGIDPNLQNKNGDTPLHLLANFNQREPIELLLSCGALKTLVNKKKQLPIHIAANVRRSKVIDLLYTDNLQTVNSEEQTLLHWAADNFDSDSDFDAFKRIFDLCKNVAAFDLFGNTPLYYAVDSGFYKAVEFLLENKSPTRTLNDKLDSPLHRAVEKLLDLSYTRISNRTQIEEIETLITVLRSARKGSPNRVRFAFDSQSSHLRTNDYRRIINLLLDNESDPEQNNEKIKSPIDLCLDCIKKNSTTDFKGSYKRIYDELYPQGKLYIPCLPTLFGSSVSNTPSGQCNSSSSSVH